jgi:hypothetical protein
MRLSQIAVWQSATPRLGKKALRKMYANPRNLEVIGAILVVCDLSPLDSRIVPSNICLSCIDAACEMLPSLPRFLGRRGSVVRWKMTIFEVRNYAVWLGD